MAVRRDFFLLFYLFLSFFEPANCFLAALTFAIGQQYRSHLSGFDPFSHACQLLIYAASLFILSFSLSFSFFLFLYELSANSRFCS
jgi:hypothetical protein